MAEVSMKTDGAGGKNVLSPKSWNPTNSLSLLLPRRVSDAAIDGNGDRPCRCL